MHMLKNLVWMWMKVKGYRIDLKQMNGKVPLKEKWKSEMIDEGDMGFGLIKESL